MSADHVPWTPARARLMAGLMMAMFVAAMDATVVSTAAPSIGRELGDFHLYPWIFAGYLLTSTTTVPIWGRLADLYGRRNVILTGLLVFVAASILCGLAPSMAALALFRALQGVGAGCIQPLVSTIAGDMFPMAQRARIQGFFSSVWALAAVTGPLLGAGFVATIGWRWIFYLNLPAGAAAVVLLLGHREEVVRSTRPYLDYAGAALLTVGVALLLVGLGSGSADGRPIPVLLGLAVLVIAAFAAVERRSPGPVIPFRLLRNPSIGPGLLVALLAGTVMFAINAFVPVYIQAGQGGSAFAAGAAIAAVALGWPVASVLVGRILMRTGLVPLMAAGSMIMVVALALLLLVAPWGAIWIGADLALVGLGLGTLMAPILIFAQNAVGWQERGAVTALNQFARTIGGAIGVAALGVLLQSGLQGVAGDPLRQGAGAQARVAAAVFPIFGVMVGIAMLALAASLVTARRGRIRAAESKHEESATT